MKPYLINPQDPQWRTPHLFAECPSCGLKGSRRATSWVYPKVGTLEATLMCSPNYWESSDSECFRVFVVTINLEEV